MRLLIYFLAVSTAQLALAETQPPAPPAPSYFSSKPLTLNEAMDLALDNQPQLAAREAMIAEARESAVAAGELPDPRLRFGFSNVPVDSFDLTEEPMTQGIVGVSQMFPGGDKRKLSAERLRHQAEQGKAALDSARRRIRRDAGLAWVNAWYPGQARQIVDRIELEYARQLEWAQAALTTNKLSLEESLTLRVMQEYVHDRKAELSRNESRARAALSRWVGEAAYRPLPAELPDTFSRIASAAGGGKPGDPSNLGNHPEVVSLTRAEAVARSEADLAREAYRPDWNVDLSYGVRGDNRSDFVSAIVSVDLPLLTEKRQGRRLAARLAAVDRMQSERDDRQRQLAADLAAARADWKAANERYSHFESSVIPLTGRRIESALAAYRSGKSSFAAVLEARRADCEARLRLLEQQAARARAAIEIQYFANEEN